MVPAFRIPRYFQILTESDKKKYIDLQTMFSSEICRNNRNQRIKTFSDTLSAVQTFCYQSNDSENDWKRCLVAGIIWLPNGMLGVNIRQFRILVHKCKSTINGSFSRLGYFTLPPRSGSLKSLSEMIPVLKNNEEIREWTVRTKASSNIPVQTSSNNLALISSAPVAFIPVYTQLLLSPDISHPSSASKVLSSNSIGFSF